MTDQEVYIEELKVDLPGKTIFRTVYFKGEKTREAKIPIGVETEITGADGRTYKVKLLYVQF